MDHIYVNQINFEHPLTGSLHDLPRNTGTNTPSIDESIVSVAHIYVNIVNLEVPVGELAAEILTNSRLATHSLVEEIIGTPVPEPVTPGGGVAVQSGPLFGGISPVEEFITCVSRSQQSVEEATYVAEELIIHGKSINGLDAVVRKPVYAKPRQIQIKSFVMDEPKITVAPPSEMSFIKKSIKEEEELLLLGII